MKRFTAVVGCIILAAVVFSADQEVAVYVDGAKMDFEPPAQVRDGKTYAPLRASAEAVSASVKWMAEQQMAVICRGASCVAIKRDQGIIVQDHLLVPLRLLSEAVGSQVRWDGDNKAVRIKSSQ